MKESQIRFFYDEVNQQTVYHLTETVIVSDEIDDPRVRKAEQEIFDESERHEHVSNARVCDVRPLFRETESGGRRNSAVKKERIGPPRLQVVNGDTLRIWLGIDDGPMTEIRFPEYLGIQKAKLFLEEGRAKVFYQLVGSHSYRWDGFFSMPVDDIGNVLTTMIWKRRENGSYPPKE